MDPGRGERWVCQYQALASLLRLFIHSVADIPLYCAALAASPPGSGGRVLPSTMRLKMLLAPQDGWDTSWEVWLDFVWSQQTQERWLSYRST